MKRMIVKNNETQHHTQAHNTWGHIVNHPAAPQSATPKVQSSPSPSTPQRTNQVFSVGQPPNEVIQSPVEVDQQENSHVQDEHEQDENQDILLEVQQERPSTYKRSWLVDVIGSIARNFKAFPICYSTWKKIRKDYKEDIIHNTIQTKFAVNSDIQINYILKLLNHKWRDSRQELWQQRDDGTRTRDELIAMAPEGIDKDHWLLLLIIDLMKEQRENGAVGLALKKERDELQIERDQMVSELEQSKKIVAALTKESDDLTKERDDLLVAAAEEREIREEMSKAIVVEHTRGFKKALRQVAHLLQVSIEGVTFDLRKDVYEGQMLPLDEIPDYAFMEAEVGVDDGVAAAEEPNAEAAGGSVVGSPDIVID
ncbi:hypothetical protein LR48_Vigan118s000300 [Vigna angularis]|uniref:Uncharacterized protein n=1 Tax=Phaseolus angularis TaxID=3914 RepID=A0A0L9T4Q1_PHAAN|nr:hypothetical protein LR48_Vigan118s000300 [Vigna angularis]